jgi:hypothetical protein
MQQQGPPPFEVQAMRPRPISAAEARIIDAITDRAHLWFPDRERRDIRMDLIAVHSAACVSASCSTPTTAISSMTIAGIERHLNRRTFKLEDCFLPRFADLERAP